MKCCFSCHQKYWTIFHTLLNFWINLQLKAILCLEKFFYYFNLCDNKQGVQTKEQLLYSYQVLLILQLRLQIEERLVRIRPYVPASGRKRSPTKPQPTASEGRTDSRTVRAKVIINNQHLASATPRLHFARFVRFFAWPCLGNIGVRGNRVWDSHHLWTVADPPCPLSTCLVTISWVCRSWI